MAPTCEKNVQIKLTPKNFLLIIFNVVYMSLHSDTLFWFRANQSLLFLLNAAFLAEKQQIPILYSFVWQDRSSYLQLDVLYNIKRKKYKTVRQNGHDFV
jgi:hypothetical protein